MFLGLRRVFLVLGRGCNFRCQYCLQQGGEKSLPAGRVEDSVLDFLRRLAAFRVRANLPPLSLMFWGGEPLVYFPEVLRVMQSLGKAFRYCMVSNGGLLDATILHALNEHEVTFTLSHDGPNTRQTRGRDMLLDDHFLGLFRRINHRAFDCVVSALAQDPYAVRAYQDQFAPGLPLHFENLHISWEGMPKALWNFDLPAYAETLDRVLAEAKQATRDKKPFSPEYGFIRKTTDIFWNRAFTPYPNNLTCGQTSTVLNLDVQGNVLACHNFDARIGTLKDSHLNLIRASNAHFALHSRKNPELPGVCVASCPYTHMETEAAKACLNVQMLTFAKVAAYINSFNEEPAT